MICVVDYETDPIRGRPNYPPKPRGVAIWMMGRYKPFYMAWGHPTENGLYELDGPDGLSGNAVRVGEASEEWAVRFLQDAWQNPEVEVLNHHEKFDADVAETHHGLRILPYHRRHDTMYQIALKDPHEQNISLKPSAERLLGLPPDEQDEVVDWLVLHQPVPGIVLVRSKKPNPNHPERQYAGAYIVWAPGNIVAKYAIGDVVRTGLIHDKIYPEFDEGMKRAYERELRLMPHLLENERQGMRVDTDALYRDIGLYHEIKTSIQDWIYARLGVDPFPLTERDTLARILDAKGLITEWVLTKSGKKSTSKKNMTMDKILDKDLFLALGYVNRLQTALSQSMEPWYEMAMKNNGRIYTQWNQVRQAHGEETKGTRTFRLSCSRFMNITKDWYDKGDYTYPQFLEAVVPDFVDLPLVRRYILPDDDCLFGHRDYSQQEFRIVAHYEDDQLRDAYRQDPKLDMHNLVRDLIRQLTGHEYGRREVKILNFGELYGMGLAKIAAGMKCDEATARKLKAAKRKAIPGVARLDNDIKRRAKEGLPIREWGGGLIFCEPPAFSEKYNKVMSFEYKMFNYLIQRSAASCTKECIIRMHEHPKYLEWCRFLVAVHDEVNSSIQRGAILEAMALKKEIMASIEFDVPMISDGKYGENWGSLKEKVE